MNTSWGFDLDMSAVRLMRREAGNWQEVAVEKIEGADIEDRLMAMVERIEPDAPVELFLPRDQILFTEVNVSSEDDALPEIERALEGRTPYALNELDFDWEMTGDSKVRVAAIALETLDEAAAFAEVRNLRVGGFSSLATPDDFPRLPDFRGHGVFDEEIEEEGDEAEPVQFATRREVSKPPPKAAGLTPVPLPEASQEPVIKVEDSQPVMQFRPRSEPPLDPGKPIDAPTSEPRVRTDIAAAAVSEHVASLTPKPSVKVRSGGHTLLRTAAVFGVALLLTIGIAMLVWRLLPLGPGGAPISEAPEAEAEQSAVMPQAESEEAVAALPAPEDAPEAEVAEIPDLPVPTIFDDVSQAAAPEADDVPVFVALTAPVLETETPKLLAALKSGEGLPQIDRSVPEASAPGNFAEILTAAPFPGPTPTEEVDETTASLSLASVDRNDLFFDAVALPPASALTRDALPALDGQSPEADVARVEPAATEASPETPEPVPVVADPTLPRPTEFAAALPDTAPRARPGGFTDTLERRRFGGRTEAELATVRPPARPTSAQIVATREAAPEATELAVASSRAPRVRPRDFDAIVASARVQQQAARVTASVNIRTPDTTQAIEAALADDAEPEVTAPAPQLSIPSNASVARQATVQNAIRLNRVNLIGVYGTTSDRRALVRLPSGRYIKVKVGDRVDGGTVARITDSELHYRKGNRTLALSIPKG